MSKSFVLCAQCGKEFEKENRAINEAKKNGWRFFCSRICQGAAKTQSEIFSCSACGKSVMVQESQREGSKSGRHFCSRSCAARVNNAGRNPTEKHRRKTSESLKGRRRSLGMRVIADNPIRCVICGKPFFAPGRKRIACSRQCGYIYQFGLLPYTKEECISRIMDVAESLGRTPTTKEVERRLTAATARYFKTWNEAMTECGLSPHTEWIRRVRVSCKDGHVADSISEMVVDNWLFEHDLAHERNKAYPGSKMTCDFYLPSQNLWLEYFGLAGEHPHYDEVVEKKKGVVKALGLHFGFLVPVDLYPTRKIAEALSAFGLSV
jgi:hypothetical protein